jgi:hypothetical protein
MMDFCYVRNGAVAFDGSAARLLSCSKHPSHLCQLAAAGPCRTSTCRTSTSCLLLEGGEGVAEHGLGVGAGDLDRLHLDALLVLHAVGLGALVLGVLVGSAAAVIEHGDHGGAAGLVHSHVEGGGAGAHAREGGGEGGGGGDERGEGNSAHWRIVSLFRSARMK